MARYESVLLAAGGGGGVANPFAGGEGGEADPVFSVYPNSQLNGHLLVP